MKPLAPMTWRISRLLPDWPNEEPPRLVRIDAVATWDEDVAGRVIVPGAEITFWLPWRPDLTLAEIEQAAYAYLRDHLPRLAAAIVPAQT
jgi:hypothetical protein